MEKNSFVLSPELLFGKTMEANEGFPSTEFQKQIILNVGRYHTKNPQQWAQRLKGPKTEVSFGITEFGNLDSLGLALTATPFIEFKAFGSNRFKVLTAMGASYFTKKFHPEKKSAEPRFCVACRTWQNTFAIAFNDTKNVYTPAGEYGWVYNNTFKVGLGFYYRFYQHCYDYIQGNESLAHDGREFDYFKSKPWNNATNLGVSPHGEIFLNHIGIDLQLGYNFYKPAYKIDYRINEGWENAPREISEDWQLETYDSKFKMKHRISSRLGLKYYLIGMEKAPKNNFYIGAHLNANLGQADFSELGFDFVHSFSFRTYIAGAQSVKPI